MAILGLCRLLIHSENSCFLKPKCADLSLRRDQTKTEFSGMPYGECFFKDGLKIASLQIYRIRLKLSKMV